jgi:chemotaxis protein methyltransferase CheR
MEYVLTDEAFASIQRLVGEQAGIVLGEHKRQLVYSRLTRRLRKLGLKDFGEYCGLIEQDEGEVVELLNAITTNLTAFFREPHHFEYMRQLLLPGIMQSNVSSRRIRIWSAGCSTGEEAYSIATVVREVLPDSGWDVKILATDIDTEVLAKAQAGVYAQERVAGLSTERQRRWFMKGRGTSTGLVRVRNELREIVVFRKLNLMGNWPMRGPFDLIVCRNVVIYFDKETQKRVFDRMADLLAPGGHLFVGHSESLFKVSDRFKLLGQTMYQRVA